ncbi:MAG: sigma-70 family RNA polymerase sigma factor [Verrucomicrobia bacterium]|nr:sigma-70 family RNA polymerase sigma factor [Verrucomicrobiota bacterium]
MADDADLLRGYAEKRDESAFAELVRRYLNLVYFAALRQVGGDAHRAEDVTQAVFTLLARKASSLTRHQTLAGWLHTTARFTASEALRAERRRLVREKEAHPMHELSTDSAAGHEWEQLRPIIDDALGELSEPDREAVLLRFFANLPFAEVGAKLNLSENTARMRVERALDKLHALLAKRGVTSTSSALAAALASQAVAMAPAGLAVSVAGSALSGAAAAGAGSLPTLLYFMSASKVSLSLATAGALVVGVAVYQSTQARAATAALTEARRGNATLAARFAELETNVSAAENERAKREAALERHRAEKTAAAATPAPAAPVDDINAKFLEIVNRLAQNDSERLKAQEVYERMQAAETYRPLFSSVGFTPQQIEQALDIIAKPSPQARDEFRAAFGEDAGDRFSEFSAAETLAARNMVNEFSAKLYFADAPFTPQQTEQLIRIVKDTNTEPRFPRQSDEALSDVFLRTRDWDRIQAQAGSFLSPEQLRGLRALVALRRNSELLAAAVNEAATPKP